MFGLVQKIKLKIRKTEYERNCGLIRYYFDIAHNSEIKLICLLNKIEAIFNKLSFDLAHHTIMILRLTIPLLQLSFLNCKAISVS